MLAPAVVPLAVAGALVGGAVWALGRASDAAIERQLRVQEASFRTARAVDRYEALRRRVERARAEYGAEVEPVPALTGDWSPRGDLDRADALAAELTARVAAAEQQLQSQLGAARASRIVAGLLRAIGGLLAARPHQTAAPAPVAAIAQQPAELSESLRRVLARLDPGGADPVVRQLEEWATQALQVPSLATAQRLLDDLRYSVDKANKAVAARRARLAELSTRMRDYAGPGIDEAQALLSAAEDDPDPDWPALEAAVTAAVERARAKAVSDYTAWALRDSLEEIGLEVEEGFDILLARNGIAHVTRPGWQDLAVRVRNRPEEQSTHFNLVAPHDGEVALDQTAEAQWCRAFDALLPALAERGIEVQVEHRTIEGEAEVQAIEPARFPFERSRRSRRDEPRRQERHR